MSENEISGWDLTKNTTDEISEEKLMNLMKTASEDILHNIVRMFRIIKQLDSELTTEQANSAKNAEDQKKMMEFCKTRYPKVRRNIAIARTLQLLSEVDRFPWLPFGH